MYISHKTWLRSVIKPFNENDITLEQYHFNMTSLKKNFALHKHNIKGTKHQCYIIGVSVKNDLFLQLKEFFLWICDK